MSEYKLNISLDVAEAELKTFHYQNGGDRLLPIIQREEKESNFLRYSVHDKQSKATILFRPSQDGGSVMIVNINDSQISAWILGVPGRSELDVNTYVGTEGSLQCEEFCTRFKLYLEEQGFLSTNDLIITKGGRPRHEEDEWAREQVLLQTRDMNDIYSEWLIRRKANNRPDLANSYDSFKKAMYKYSK